MRNPAAQGRPDANQAQVICWYEELYCSVVDLSDIGGGCPDLLIGCSGRDELVEVKTEEGHLKRSQLDFQHDWRGFRITVVRTQADVINHVQNMRERVHGRFSRTHR